MFQLGTFLLIGLVPIAASQSEGDVRLADGYTAQIAIVGRLEIYFNNRWGTFCGLSIGGAQAACMQMGFYDFVKYDPWYMTSKKVPSAEPDTPIIISTTTCDRSFRGDVRHILRCGYSTDVPPSCNHTADTVLGCSTISLWRYPYEMQVRLNKSGSVSSSGTLEIYHNTVWGNICFTGFTMKSADSACRQMGYTSASSYSASQASTNTVWLDQVSCIHSCDCLTGCFSGFPSTSTFCSDDLGFVQVQCTYNVQIQDKFSSGTEYICTNNQTTCGDNTAGSSSSTVTIIAVVCGVLIFTIIFITIGASVLYIKVKRKGYTSINST